MGSEHPTVLEAPTVVEPGSLSSERSTRSSTIELPKPETVLRTADIDQSRRMAITGVLFNVGAIACWPFLGGDPRAKIIAWISLGAAAVNNGLLWYSASDVRRYTQRAVIVYFALASILNAGIIYYLGIFGPILVMFVLNVYTACLGYDRTVARVTLVGSIAPYVAVAVPITLGWIPDPGLISLAHESTIGRALVIAAFTGFLVLVYSQARAARELIMTSLSERDEAVRKASHREALFIEARRDLERALSAGGQGRFTDQVLGSYKLGTVLARGGMGEVYEAVHVTDGTRAAVKMLLPEVLDRPDYVRRFLREVRIAASLDSPHVVAVLEVGDESAALPFLAMERLEGEDLAQILRREERLAHDAVVDLVRQVGNGLRAAHAAGIVHRDLKPQNLFRAGSVWKILDFGVSKLLDAGTVTDGFAVGTPQYMAPEQARGEDVTAATDMYGLGAIAYRAITGRSPFVGADATEVLVAVLMTMPIRPSALVKVRRDVDLVLAIAMAKSPKDRFETGEAFAVALEEAMTGRLDSKLRRRGSDLLAAAPWQEPLAAKPRAEPR